MADVPRLSTRVGQATHGDNRFRGRSVHDELTGTLPYWSLLSVAIGHRPLTSDECAVLDALSVAACAADPRIWPLKAVRIGSAHGSATLGLCAGVLATDGAQGPRVSGACAEILVAMRHALAEVDDDAILEPALEPYMDGRFPGFGVAARSNDERVVAFADWCTQSGRSLGEHWALMRRIEAITTRRRMLRVNISGATAAVLLDMGFAPAQIHLPALFVAMPNFVANAAEGALQAPEVLRELPASVVRYVGAPPRRSKRPR